MTHPRALDRNPIPHSEFLILQTSIFQYSLLSSAVGNSTARTNQAATLAVSDGLRRSTRQSAAQSARRSPAFDPDELYVASLLLHHVIYLDSVVSVRILVYPPSGTGAVNITKADLNRLQPGEYLNDTLIEFGLKFVKSLSMLSFYTCPHG
jgi:hypothetical protein